MSFSVSRSDRFGNRHISASAKLPTQAAACKPASAKWLEPYMNFQSQLPQCVNFKFEGPWGRPLKERKIYASATMLGAFFQHKP
eukprot:635517-Pelagomonas_calceolata.AAC.1